MRTFKFRVWATKDKRWELPTSLEVFSTSGQLECLYKDQEYIIEQYTGLLDRNGKEIYVGDVLILPESLKELDITSGIVEYESGSTGCRMAYDLQLMPFVDISLEELKNLEIIGNIHENPDLLDK